MTVPIPRPSYLSKFCLPVGARDGEKRWRNPEGTRIYAWDSLHGEIEVWNNRGVHLGALNPITGALKKQPDPRKTLNVK
ncbi:MAG: hypothetical protein LCH63_21480 [Candidatus Melainabacteria bacterium]|nr:hypothetical protein [Candidatus Melainabacteria bacterium]